MPIPVRIGIIGCGGISNAHAAASKMLSSARIVACCDVNPEAAKKFSSQYGCNAVYADFRDMIKKESLDGVILATWPIQHREQLESCFDAGVRAILCEKALVMNRVQALDILRQVKSRGLILMEGLMFRHHPAFRRMEKILLTEDLGRIDSIRAVCNSYMPEPDGVPQEQKNWRHRKECGGGVTYDFLSYVVNACNHFASLQGGSPIRAFASGTISPASRILSRLSGIIEYDTGVIAHVEASHHAAFNQEFQVSASHGVLDLPTAWNIYSDTAITFRHAKAWAQVLTDTYRIPAADPYAIQLDNFAALIRSEAQAQVPLIQSVINAVTVDALVGSVKERKALQIELPDELHSQTPAIAESIVEAEAENN